MEGIHKSAETDPRLTDAVPKNCEFLNASLAFTTK